MKTYKVIKDFKNELGITINKGIIINYEINPYINLLINNGFLEEIKENKVEQFLEKIFIEYKTSTKNYLDVIRDNIKDNGKEEVTKKMKMYFEKYMGYVGENDHRIIDSFLNNYIIIKI